MIICHCKIYYDTEAKFLLFYIFVLREFFIHFFEQKQFCEFLIKLLFEVRFVNQCEREAEISGGFQCLQRTIIRQISNFQLSVVYKGFYRFGRFLILNRSVFDIEKIVRSLDRSKKGWGSKIRIFVDVWDLYKIIEHKYLKFWTNPEFVRFSCQMRISSKNPWLPSSNVLISLFYKKKSFWSLLSIHLRPNLHNLFLIQPSKSYKLQYWCLLYQATSKNYVTTQSSRILRKRNLWQYRTELYNFHEKS